MAKSQTKSPMAPDALLEKLKRHDTQLREFLKETAAKCFAAEKRSSGKKSLGKKSLQILIRSHGMDEINGLPRGISAEPSDVFSALCVMRLIDALSASRKSCAALKQGRIDDSFNEYIRAEKLLGQAMTFSVVDDVNSAIASWKARLRHAKTNYARRKEAINFWRSKVDPKLSAAKAAEYISEMYFAKRGIEISYRTLAEWVAEEKKKEKPRHPSE